MLVLKADNHYRKSGIQTTGSSSIRVLDTTSIAKKGVMKTHEMDKSTKKEPLLMRSGSYTILLVFLFYNNSFYKCSFTIGNFYEIDTLCLIAQVNAK